MTTAKRLALLAEELMLPLPHLLTAYEAAAAEGGASGPPDLVAFVAARTEHPAFCAPAPRRWARFGGAGRA